MQLWTGRAFKGARVSGLAIILFGIILSSSALTHAQELELQRPKPEYRISELVSVDWKTSTVTDSISLKTVLDRCAHGHDQLREAIKANPDQFPLHELENPQMPEPDDHRRWEYQMKRMPVQVVAVSDFSDFLLVDFQADLDTITFCETNVFQVKAVIRNTSATDLPNFMLSFKKLPGVSVKSVKLVSDQSAGKLRSTNRRTLSFMSNGLAAGQGAEFDLQFTVDCDGKGGSASLPDRETFDIFPQYVFELVGYPLDYANKQLYKVVARGHASKSLIITPDHDEE